MPTGSPIAYVAGNGHLPIPTTSDLLYRRSHQPQQAKPQGLDWSALAPTCGSCTNRSSEVGADGLCPGCRNPEPVTTAALTTPPRQPSPRRPARNPRPARTQGPTATQAARAAFDARAVEEYLSGKTAPQVAQLLGSNNRRVYDALDRQGVERRDDRNRPRAKPAAPSRLQEERARTAAALVADYTASSDVFISDLAAKYDVGLTTARAILDRAGVVRRDDRLRRSGGRPRTYDETVIADVRRLYVDDQLSRTEIAERLGIPYKSVVTIMKRNGITARSGQSGRCDGASSLKERIASLGVSAREIKDWAIRERLLLELGPGIPPARVVDAYAAAHSEQKERISA